MSNENGGWVVIPKYPAYEISADLQVRHRKLKRIKKFYLDDKGYMRTNVNYNGRKHKPGHHQLVAYTFIPNPENKIEVNHIDGNKLNNAISNLEWATQLENKAHAKANMLIAHKLKPQDVVFVRENFGKLSIDEMAEKYGVKKLTIQGIVTGRTRKDVGGPISEIGPYKKIIQLSTGLVYVSAEALSKVIGISIKEIRRQLTGERYNTQVLDYRYIGGEDRVRLKPPRIPPKPRVYIPKPPRERPPKKIKIKNPVTPSKPIIKIDAAGNEIERYSSIGSAARAVGADKCNLRYVISGSGYYKGFFYRPA